jgi:hypothetical protein
VCLCARAWERDEKKSEGERGNGNDRASAWVASLDENGAV